MQAWCTVESPTPAPLACFQTETSSIEPDSRWEVGGESREVRWSCVGCCQPVLYMKRWMCAHNYTPIWAHVAHARPWELNICVNTKSASRHQEYNYSLWSGNRVTHYWYLAFLVTYRLHAEIVLARFTNTPIILATRWVLSSMMYESFVEKTISKFVVKSSKRTLVKKKCVILNVHL